jgi:hypothetical protein
VTRAATAEGPAMYKLLMFRGLTQIILGVLLAIVGAAIAGVNRIFGEDENHIWLVLIGFVAIFTIFAASE